MKNEQIGKELKKIRTEQGITLDMLSKKANVSPGLISQIERGKTCPTVVTLWKILEPLNTSIGKFLTKSEKERKIVVKKNERKLMNLSNSEATYELLTPDLDGDIEFIKVIMKPGVKNTNDGLISHEGEECGIVVQGKLKIVLDDKEYILEKGDSIRFDSSTPHVFINIGSEKSVSYWAMTPPSF